MAKAKQTAALNPGDENASNAPDLETAVDGDTVEFRFNQHCFSPLGQGAMDEIKRLPVENARRLQNMGVGKII